MSKEPRKLDVAHVLFAVGLVSLSISWLLLEAYGLSLLQG